MNDDNEAIVNAAKAFGLNAILFTGYSEVAESLKHFLVKTNKDGAERSDSHE